MTIAPLLVTAAIALIIILSLTCFCFATAWRRAEIENAVLRKRRIGWASDTTIGRVR